MRYAVEIDLDYGLLPQAEVHAVWQMLRAALLEAGFRADGRRFVSNQLPTEAARTVHRTLEALERQLQREGRNLHRCLRSCYGYPLACADNLLLPPTEAIEVRAEVA